MWLYSSYYPLSVFGGTVCTCRFIEQTKFYLLKQQKENSIPTLLELPGKIFSTNTAYSDLLCVQLEPQIITFIQGSEGQIFCVESFTAEFNKEFFLGLPQLDLSS